MYKCELCRRKKHSQKQQRRMQLFPPNGALEIAAINILGPSTKARQGIRFEIVVTHRYRKLVRAIPTAKDAAPVVGTITFEH